MAKRRDRRDGAMSDTNPIEAAVAAARAQARKARLTPAQMREAERRAAILAEQDERKRALREQDTARKLGRAAVRAVKPTLKALPHVDLYILKLMHKCERSEPYGGILTECRRLIPYVDELDPALLTRLTTALRDMLARSTRGAEGVTRALESGDGARRWRKRLSA